MKEPRPKPSCHQKALDAIARSPRSSAELRRWLTQREYGSEEVDETLDRLTAAGLLDDEAYARTFARSRATGKGFGTRRIVAELARRGIARPTVDRVLAELEPELADAGDAALRRAAARKAASLSRLDPQIARRRLIAWLLRRGSGGGQAAVMARELLPGEMMRDEGGRKSPRDSRRRAFPPLPRAASH